MTCFGEGHLFLLVLFHFRTPTRKQQRFGRVSLKCMSMLLSDVKKCAKCNSGKLIAKMKEEKINVECTRCKMEYDLSGSKDKDNMILIPGKTRPVRGSKYLPAVVAMLRGSKYYDYAESQVANNLDPLGETAWYKFQSGPFFNAINKVYHELMEKSVFPRIKEAYISMGFYDPSKNEPLRIMIGADTCWDKRGHQSLDSTTFGFDIVSNHVVGQENCHRDNPSGSRFKKGEGKYDMTSGA